METFGLKNLPIGIRGVHDWETGNDYFVVSSNAQMPSIPECKVYDYKAIKEELQPVIQHYIQFLSTWNADGSVGIEKCIYKYRQDADVTSNEYTKHRGCTCPFVYKDTLQWLQEN